MSRARPTKHRFTTADKAREWLERKGFVFQGNEWTLREGEGVATIRERNGEHLVTVRRPFTAAEDLGTAVAILERTARAAAEPDYASATDRELELLGQYGNTQAIRKRAAAELQRRLAEYAALPADELRRIAERAIVRDDRDRAARELHRRDRARLEPKPIDTELEPLAARHCGLETLTQRDGDFKEVSVIGLRNALRAAYEAGLAAGAAKKGAR